MNESDILKWLHHPQSHYYLYFLHPIIIILHYCVINWFICLFSLSTSKINAEFPGPETEYGT